MIRTLLFGFLTGVSLTVQAAVVFQDLGTGAPPGALGRIPVYSFAAQAQAAIADDTQVTTIPGSPIGGVLTLDLPACKATVPATWNGWSHGYTGPVFQTAGCPPSGPASPTSRILTLPAGTRAFYFYANQQNDSSIQTITATSDTGTTSGPITIPAVVNTANGYGFFSNAGENIATITISTSDPTGFGFGEFGIGLYPVDPIPALGDWSKVVLITLCLVSGMIVLRRRRRR